jgi:hypothetical protein
MTATGQKKGIFALEQAKAGQSQSAHDRAVFWHAHLKANPGDVSTVDRCYEAARDRFKLGTAGGMISITIS